MKNWMKITLFLAAFFASAPFVLGWLLNLFYPRIDVTADTVLDAHVTGIYRSRDLRMHYLDGDTKSFYDFNGFGLALTPAEKQARHIDDWNTPSLSHYLQVGDYLTKAAHSPDLTVTRGQTVTHWVLAAE